MAAAEIIAPAAGSPRVPRSYVSSRGSLSGAAAANAMATLAAASSPAAPALHGDQLPRSFRRSSLVMAAEPPPPPIDTGAPLPPSLILAMAADAHTAQHDAHMQALSAPHVRRRLATLVHPRTAPLPPAVAASTRALTEALPPHVQLAAERHLYPKPLKQTMMRSALGLVDQIDSTISGAQGARETLILRRMRIDSHPLDSTPETIQSVRDHPYFAAASSPDPDSATPRLDALLRSSFFTTSYTHKFEDESLPPAQRLALDKCRHMEHYKRDLQKQVVEAQRLGLDVEAFAPTQRRKKKRAYRFNDEQSDESSEEDEGHNFLVGIRGEVEAAAEHAVVPVFVTPMPLRPSTSPAITGGAISPRKGKHMKQQQPQRLPSQILTTRPPPAVLQELAKLRAENIKREHPRHNVAMLHADVAVWQQQVEEEKQLAEVYQSNANASSSPHALVASPALGPTAANLQSLESLADASLNPTSDSSTARPFYASVVSSNVDSWMSGHGKLRKRNVDVEQISRCSKLFSLLDGNGDGVVELQEMAGALKALNIKVDMRKLKASLRDFDPDSDGCISFEEFLHGFSSIATWDKHLDSVLAEKSELKAKEEQLRAEAKTWEKLQRRKAIALRAAKERQEQREAKENEVDAKQQMMSATRSATQQDAATASAQPLSSSSSVARTELSPRGSEHTQDSTPLMHSSTASLQSMRSNPTASAPSSPPISPRNAQMLAAETPKAPSLFLDPPSVKVEPLPPTGVAAGLSLAERQAIADLRARTAARKAQAEARFVELTAARVAAIQEASAKDSNSYARALKRKSKATPRRALPADVALSLGLSAFEARPRGAIRTAAASVKTGATKPAQAKAPLPAVSEATDALLDSDAPAEAAPVSSDAHSGVPFFLWTAAFQRHSKLSTLIAEHKNDQEADLRQQALELEQHRAELDAAFAAAAAQGNSAPLYSPRSASSTALAKRRESMLLQSLTERSQPMPLLNYSHKKNHSKDVLELGSQASAPSPAALRPLSPIAQRSHTPNSLSGSGVHRLTFAEMARESPREVMAAPLFAPHSARVRSRYGQHQPSSAQAVAAAVAEHAAQQRTHLRQQQRAGVAALAAAHGDAKAPGAGQTWLDSLLAKTGAASAAATAKRAAMQSADDGGRSLVLEQVALSHTATEAESAQLLRRVKEDEDMELRVERAQACSPDTSPAVFSRRLQKSSAISVDISADHPVTPAAPLSPRAPQRSPRVRKADHVVPVPIADFTSVPSFTQQAADEEVGRANASTAEQKDASPRADTPNSAIALSVKTSSWPGQRALSPRLSSRPRSSVRSPRAAASSASDASVRSSLRGSTLAGSGLRFAPDHPSHLRNMSNLFQQLRGSADASELLALSNAVSASAESPPAAASLHQRISSLAHAGWLRDTPLPSGDVSDADADQ